MKIIVCFALMAAGLFIGIDRSSNRPCETPRSDAPRQVAVVVTDEALDELRRNLKVLKSTPSEKYQCRVRR